MKRLNREENLLIFCVVIIGFNVLLIGILNIKGIKEDKFILVVIIIKIIKYIIDEIIEYI